MYESLLETAKTTALGTIGILVIAYTVRLVVKLISVGIHGREKPEMPAAKNLAEEELRASIIEEGKRARENLERNKYTD